ncbi:putative pre-mRNA-splicing factor ATP-dependent RNA helicase DEAH4 [Camellia lanceoleosa]|nr:putative pre-mRNA-splicing factor ATP-dependent RNA helicase DEAH4 [Camellia lanceoleosa]
MYSSSITNWFIKDKTGEQIGETEEFGWLQVCGPTLEFLRYVIDSGYVKQRQYNPSTGMYSLDVVQISRYLLLVAGKHNVQLKRMHYETFAWHRG